MSDQSISMLITKLAAVAQKNPNSLPAICQTVVEAAEVITLCTQHQQRIVDDVRQT